MVHPHNCLYSWPKKPDRLQLYERSWLAYISVFRSQNVANLRKLLPEPRDNMSTCCRSERTMSLESTHEFFASSLERAEVLYAQVQNRLR